MTYLRPSAERGHVNLGWLDSRHSFSFGNYFDRDHMGFGPLRVINEDQVQPGEGFGSHGHRDMEILTYVVDGALAHQDSLGNGSVIRPGDLQRMTAGTGIRHSEYNHSQDAVVKFLQIWVVPEKTDLTPGYEQRHFEPADLQNRLRLVASRTGGDGAVSLNRDVDLYAARLDTGTRVAHRAARGRRLWLQLIDGQVRANDETLSSGDGLGLAEQAVVEIEALAPSHLLLFDLGN